MKWNDQIVVDPAVCHGQPCFTGTRVLVHVVLDNLAAGVSPKTILEQYPSLSADSLQAAMAYAADLAREPLMALPE